MVLEYNAVNADQPKNCGLQNGRCSLPAEGRVISSVNASGSNWQDPMYNALGQRIGEHQAAGSNDSTYLYYPRDIFGHRTEMFEYHPSAGWAGADVWWARVAGQRLEMGGGNSWLAHVNVVGSLGMETNQTGTVTWDAARYPWGRFWKTAGSRISGLLFAGMQWQGNDPSIPSATRFYNPPLGRWISPDKLAGNVLNPQSLNRYAYVTNNPTSFNDPSGLYLHVPWGCFGDSSGFGYYCPNASDEQPSDFGVGFVNPILPRFLPGGNGQGAFLIHMTVTSKAPAAGTSLPQRLGCAAQYGEEHSLASFLGVNHNIFGNALFGNTISDVTNAFLFVASGSGSPAQTGAVFALNGPALGIPVASSNPGLRSVTGTAIETGVGSFLNGVRGVGTEPIELGLGNAGKIATEVLPVAPELVGQIAGGIGVAKVVIDAVIDGYAYVGPCSQ